MTTTTFVGWRKCCGTFTCHPTQLNALHVNSSRFIDFQSDEKRLGDWLHTEMVYLSKDSQSPIQMMTGRAYVNYVDETQRVDVTAAAKCVSVFVYSES